MYTHIRMDCRSMDSDKGFAADVLSRQQVAVKHRRHNNIVSARWSYVNISTIGSAVTDGPVNSSVSGTEFTRSHATRKSANS
jgi:hypothetical protein